MYVRKWCQLGKLNLPWEKEVERRRKISEAHKGKKLTEEHRRKISEGLKKQSREAIQKRATSNRGKRRSDETRRRISEALKGKSPSEETRRKWSEVRKGRTPWNKGKSLSPLSEDTKRKLSEALKGRTLPDEARRKIGEANRLSLMGQKQSLETRLKRSEKLKAYLASLTPEQRRERAAAAILASRKANPSKLEKTVEQVLMALKEPFEAQKRIGPYFVDFYLPQRNLILECDGEYWHSLPERKERDAKRDAWLRGQGYVVVRIKESDVQQDARLAVIRSLSMEVG